MAVRTKYKNRVYSVDVNGLDVSLGERRRFFKWGEFEYFYQNPDDDTSKADKDRIDYVAAMKQLRGEKFYLKLKSSREIVVVYSEPDNYKEAYEFFKNALPEKFVGMPGIVKYLYK